MYEKNDKRRLYWLIDEILADKITESEFCDEYYFSYDLALDHQTLSDMEKKLFKDISAVASRFSEFEEDHNMDRKAFTDKAELRTKISEVKAILNLL